MEFQQLNPSLLEFVRVHNLAAVRVALQKPLELESVDKHMKTPLMIATENEDFPIAKFLIESGANVNARDIYGNTPFMVAVSEGYTELVQLMLRASPDFSICNRFGGSALTCACERGHVEVVRALLSSRYIFDIDHRDELGWTPLMETVILGDGGERYVEIARLLISAGADIQALDGEGRSCLDHAVRRELIDLAVLFRTQKT